MRVRESPSCDRIDARRRRAVVILAALAVLVAADREAPARPSWLSLPRASRPANRVRNPVEFSDINVGFRVVRVLP